MCLLNKRKIFFINKFKYKLKKYFFNLYLNLLIFKSMSYEENYIYVLSIKY